MSRSRRAKGALPRLAPCEHCDTDQPPQAAHGRGGGTVWVCRGCGAVRQDPARAGAGGTR